LRLVCMVCEEVHSSLSYSLLRLRICKNKHVYRRCNEQFSHAPNCRRPVCVGRMKKIESFSPVIQPRGTNACEIGGKDNGVYRAKSGMRGMLQSQNSRIFVSAFVIGQNGLSTSGTSRLIRFQASPAFPLVLPQLRTSFYRDTGRSILDHPFYGISASIATPAREPFQHERNSVRRDPERLYFPWRCMH
jgi:hypothetical protein